MYNHKQKSNAPLKKKHKWADRKGGVNPYGQPDRKISVFFLTTSLTLLWKKVVDRVERAKEELEVKDSLLAELYVSHIAQRQTIKTEFQVLLL